MGIQGKMSHFRICVYACMYICKFSIFYVNYLRDMTDDIRVDSAYSAYFYKKFLREKFLIDFPRRFTC